MVINHRLGVHSEREIGVEAVLLVLTVCSQVSIVHKLSHPAVVDISAVFYDHMMAYIQVE